MPLPRCSIVIRTLNEGRYLDQVLTSVARQDYPTEALEVVVVDSGSEDDTLSIAARHGCRIVHIRREDFSFGRSLNLGSDHADGEILIFISGHCVPTGNRWLSELVTPFQQEEVAVTYGRQQGGPESKFSEHCLFEKYFPVQGNGDHQAPFFCNNANSAFRRTAWSLHRFDETLTGLEDMHLSRRLWEAGQRVVYAPEASVYHYHHESWRQVMRRYEREAIALQKIMPEIHIHWHDALRYFAAGVLSDTSKALVSRMLLRSFSEIIAFRYCQFAGAWKGNHTHRQLSRREKEKYFYPH